MRRAWVQAKSFGVENSLLKSEPAQVGSSAFSSSLASFRQPKLFQVLQFAAVPICSKVIQILFYGVERCLNLGRRKGRSIF